MSPRTLIALFVVSLTACNPEVEPVTSLESRLEEGVPEAVLSLGQQGDLWREKLSATLTKGGKLRIDYNPERLPQCRGEANGLPAWSISGYARINGGPIDSFEVAGHSPSSGTEQPVLELTQAGELELWFQVTNRWGCSTYDSRFGQNYRFRIAEPATITFPENGDVQVSGSLGAASALVVTYDLDRLPSCRAVYRGFAAWDVLVFARFDGGEVTQRPLTRSLGGTLREEAPAVVAIPAGAQKVELWFKSNDVWGCSSYDSRNGQNYAFSLR
jgi:hypothetical protein